MVMHLGFQDQLIGLGLLVQLVGRSRPGAAALGRHVEDDSLVVLAHEEE